MRGNTYYSTDHNITCYPTLHITGALRQQQANRKNNIAVLFENAATLGQI
jgi:hypothetical protein